jgi:subfamily B ATP-binding cassette protein MsbA
MKPERVLDKLIVDERKAHVFRRIMARFVRPYTRRLLLAVAVMAVVSGTTALTAWLMDPVVNEVFVNQNHTMLWAIGGAVLATFLVKSVATFVQAALMSSIGFNIVADIKRALFRHLLDQDVSLFQEQHSGTLLSRFTYDVVTMRNVVSNVVVSLGRELLTVVFLAGVMIYQDWLLALIALLVAPLSAYPVHWLGRRVKHITHGTQRAMGELTARMSQSFQSIRIVKAYNLEDRETAHTEANVRHVYDLAYKSALAKAATQPLIDAAGGAAITAVILYGGSQVISGATTPGAFFSFITACLMAYQPMRALGKTFAQLQEGLAAAERVFELLDRQPKIREPEAPKALPRAPASIAFDDVTFAYQRGQPALDRVSLEAPKGQTTALVGPSGAGKSTVLTLIPRFFDPDSGIVRVAGHDLRELSLTSLRDSMALVTQEVAIFDDTVAENIRMGRADATDAEVREAAAAAAAHDFISELSDGYATQVGENGTRLSGGQRQRISIARAILKDAPILLLDEATSALDTESEKQIQTALTRLMQGRTTLVIAHRLSTVMNADRIYVMDRGQVVEQGTHGELIGRAGTYAKLYDLQFAA